MIDELAQDLAAHEDLSNPAVKLPCYRIVQRVQPSCMKSMLPHRTAFPIQYSLLRKAPHLKVLLGVDSVAWLTNTRDHRLAIQVQIQNQGKCTFNILIASHVTHFLDRSTFCVLCEPRVALV